MNKKSTTYDCENRWQIIVGKWSLGKKVPKKPVNTGMFLLCYRKRLKE